MGSIWTYGEHFRFATVDQGYIIIWEIGFASEHGLSRVETLPVPNEVYYSAEPLFLPTPSRLAFDLQGSVRVWDVQGSRDLLNFQVESTTWTRRMVFSPDGRFFACGASDQKFCIWKESPSGYTLHRELMLTGVGSITASFSPNGESFTVQHFFAIQRWHTRDPTPLSSGPNQSGCHTNFILGFSPDRTLAAVARLYEDTITILDLTSGGTRLTIEAGMETLCLRMAGRSIVVVGKEKVITWELPTGDSTFGARVNVNDSVQTSTFNYPGQHPDPPAPNTSISLGLDRIAVVVWDSGGFIAMNVCDLSTGKWLQSTSEGGRELLPTNPWFTPDGREVWCLDEGQHGWALTEDENSNLTELESLGLGTSPSGAPWQSFGRYEDTSNGWITNSSRKRVLWLPHSLRFHRSEGIWEGRFLGLSNRTLLEAVILESHE